MSMKVHGFYLKFSGVHPVVALYEGIAKIVNAEFLQAFQCGEIEIQIVWVPAWQRSMNN